MIPQEGNKQGEHCGCPSFQPGEGFQALVQRARPQAGPSSIEETARSAGRQREQEVSGSLQITAAGSSWVFYWTTIINVCMVGIPPGQQTTTRKGERAQGPPRVESLRANRHRELPRKVVLSSGTTVWDQVLPRFSLWSLKAGKTQRIQHFPSELTAPQNNALACIRTQNKSSSQCLISDHKLTGLQRSTPHNDHKSIELNQN